MIPVGSSMVITTAGFWFAVLFVTACTVGTIMAVAYLAYRARIARERFQAQESGPSAEENVRVGNEQVLEFARARRETEAEFAEGRKRLEGMEDAFTRGLKG